MKKYILFCITAFSPFFFVIQSLACPEIRNLTVTPEVSCLDATDRAATFTQVTETDGWIWYGHIWKYEIRKVSDDTVVQPETLQAGDEGSPGDELPILAPLLSNQPDRYKIRARAYGKHEPDGEERWGPWTGWVTFTVFKVDFVKLYETSNPANKIFNPTPKDDPPPVLMNRLYITEAPADSRYHVTLDVNDQPSSMRSKLMHAVYDGSAKLSTGEAFYPMTGPADIVFNHPAPGLTVTDFEIKVGYDLNGNSSLDASEILCPLHVTDTTGTIIGPPMARGASTFRYASASLVVDTGVLDVLVPHARRLLQIFRDAGTGLLPVDKRPTSSGIIGFNCFSGSFSEWLTHNCGAGFSPAGAATIPYYVWDIDTSLSKLVGTSYQITHTGEEYYSATALSTIQAYFLTKPVGHVAAFPSQTGYYIIPHVHESPSWVPATTVTFDEPLQANGVNDDVNASIGRGRVKVHKARFTVEKKKSILGNEYLYVNQARYSGEVDDLYDFNFQSGGPAGDSAIVQIGYGNGSYSGRTAGVIYREHIIFDEIINDPF